MLDAETKAKWIAALRSGDYKQTKNALKNSYSDSYCCLGVLCVVSGIEAGGYAYPVIANLVPNWVRYSKMNDAQGKDFNYIADCVEKEL